MGFLKKRLKAFLMRHPELGIKISEGIRPFRFHVERRAYAGSDRGDGNARPSLVFLTHYRCASMMVMKRLADLVSGLGYKVRDYQGYVHPWPLEQRSEFQLGREEHARVGRFRPKGRLYAPLRYYVDIPDLPDFKTIVLLRDPRDVVTSRYYSERYAHVRLDKRFLEHCRRVEKMELDEFVLEIAPSVADQYRLFMSHAEALRNAHFVRYEDMIGDFEGFLQGVNDYAGLGRSDGFVKAIAEKESFEVNTEDKFSHKRSVKARNFEEKLKPETVETLNEVYGDILTFFGWEGAGQDRPSNPFGQADRD